MTEEELDGPEFGDVVEEVIITGPTPPRSARSTPALSKSGIWTFARNIAEGQRKIEAYRDAFKTGHDVPDRVINARANAVAKKPLFLKLLGKFRASLRMEMQVSVEQHLLELKRIGAEAEKTGDFKTALKSEEARGRVWGYGTRKDIHITHETSREEVLAKLKAIAGRNPEMVRNLIEARGTKVIELENNVTKMSPQPLRDGDIDGNIPA